jgi:protein-S-isoprenylcysteine O-methyltransferase Ste14
MMLSADLIYRLTWIALAWLGYFVVHSSFASLRVKKWIADSYPGVMPFYRTTFNVLSLLLLIPIAIGIYADSGPWLWRWTGIEAWIALGLRLSAVIGFVVSLRSYDLSAFLGLRQIHAERHEVNDHESLRISSLHRYVRHPWYFLLLVILWSGDMNASLLLSAVIMTGYLVIGARLEEQKLVACYGAAYADYMTSVGGLIPMPGKVLSRRRAAELEARAAARVDMARAAGRV